MTEGDASRAGAPAPGRTSRADWVDAALRTLVAEGIENVRVLVLAQRFGVSRSSFYWHFTDRADLLAAMLDHWRRTNTAAILARAEAPAPGLAAAVLNVFDCWRDPALFDPRLDFAVRDWGRRSATTRAAVTEADGARIGALTAMFARHGTGGTEALVRARTLYYSQIGYYALEVAEPQAARDALLAEYVRVHAGVAATEAELSAFLARAPGGPA